MNNATNDRPVGPRILIVEDEMLIAWAIEDLLTGLGYQVVGPATRVAQAIEMIDKESIDAAVVDLDLNGEKSYPVADRLVAAGVPFIFSTGYQPGNIPKDYQMFPAMQKPYASASLDHALAKLLNTRPSGY